MMRLKSKLLSLNQNKTVKVKVYSPKNCEELRIPFKQDKVAKVVGKLASIPPPKQLPTPEDDTRLITGVLVQNDFKLSLMAPEDLREYAGLTTTTMICKQRIQLSAAGIDLIKWGLEGTFGKIEELPEMKVKPDATEKNVKNDDSSSDTAAVEAADEELPQVVAAYLIMGCVTMRYRSSGEIELEWEGNLLNDSIADSVLTVLYSVESSPAAVKRSAQKSKHSHHHHHDHAHHNGNGNGNGNNDENGLYKLPTRNLHANVTPEERLERLFMFLEAQFGADNVAPIAEPKLPPMTIAASTAAAAASEADKKKPKNNNNNAAATTKKEGEDTPMGENGDASAASGGEEEEEDDDDDNDDDDNDDGKESEAQLEARKKAELDRLHRIGIPVPGVAIKVDKMNAQVWLEDLEVESNHKAFGDRVRSVVDRAVETIAPLWD